MGGEPGGWGGSAISLCWDGRALKLVLRPGHGDPSRCIPRVGLSGGWDPPKERPLSSHWLDQKSLEAKRAVCSVGPSRPHPDSGLRSRACSRGAAGLRVRVEDWQGCCVEPLCSLVLSLA